MPQHELSFMASQAADSIHFRGNPAEFGPGDAAWWSMPSFEVTDDNTLANLKPDGGLWQGMVQILPNGSFNMQANWSPVKGGPDSIQFLGPVQKDQPVSHVAIVGGTGKYAGCRGQARATVAMSDQNTPIFGYSIVLEE